MKWICWSCGRENPFRPLKAVQDKCPKCGELFSDSYKECPFCAEDEELAQGGKARHGRRIQRQKSPSIGGPVLVIVIVFLAAYSGAWTIWSPRL